LNSKKWTISFLTLTFFLLLLGAAPTVLVDPYFHFHKPMPKLSYVMDNQRYQNDGIVQHFSYDAIITGTSMTENFKTTEMDALFGTNSVKVCFSGGSFKEIADNQKKAFSANSGIRYVIRGVDCNRICDHKDKLDYEDNLFPTYLYDRNPFNDVQYVLNKQVLFADTSRVLAYTNAGLESTTFDDYSNWDDAYTYGKEAVMKGYNRPEKAAEKRVMTDAEFMRMRGNVDQNYLELARENPETQFYYFFTPYSIAWWDSIQRNGTLEWYISLMKEASQMMVECDNVHLFSFFDATDMVCDLSNYKDIAHYSGDINSQLLQWMKEEEHRLTVENYEAHWNAVLDFYSTYDYERLFMD